MQGVVLIDGRRVDCQPPERRNGQGRVVAGMVDAAENAPPVDAVQVVTRKIGAGVHVSAAGLTV
jgi:hypothetical protein